MNLAVNTDFLTGTGKPEPRLKDIAEAGFTHLHWCHHWCDDFLYSVSELEAIGGNLKDFGLKLLDIHGTAGQEKCWYSTTEYERKAGVALVRNRLEMFDALGGSGALMMHIPFFKKDGQTPENRTQVRLCTEALKRSLDELMPYVEKYHCPIAVENMWIDTWEIINELLDIYPARSFGITYDSGHANSNGLKQMDFLEQRKDRLQALHLHDNDGNGDRHQPPFMGTVDWERLAGIIATSSYSREISYEISIRNTPFMDPDTDISEQKPENVRAFLADAHRRCEKFAHMVRG